jgi:hypothetical protein
MQDDKLGPSTSSHDNDTLQSSLPQDDMYCRNITQFQDDLLQETKQLDNILCHLCHYYKEVKMKRQLGLEVMAGFRASTDLQKNFNTFTPPRRSKSTQTLPSIDSFTVSDPVNLSCLSDTSSNIVLESTSHTDSTNESVPCPSHGSHHKPIVRSIDKASTSLPDKITMSEDFVQSLKKYLSDLYMDNINIDSIPVDAILDAGDLAIMRKKGSNAKAVSRPLHFGDVFHVDICFWPRNLHWQQYTLWSLVYRLLQPDDMYLSTSKFDN